MKLTVKGLANIGGRGKNPFRFIYKAFIFANYKIGTRYTVSGF